MVTRGDVWLARLDPTEGREIRKTRPCAIISPPEVHDYLDIVLAAPLTTGLNTAGFALDRLVPPLVPGTLHANYHVEAIR